MERQGQPRDFLSQWAEFQKGFFNQWTNFLSKTYPPGVEAMKFWPGMKTPFAPADLFPKWSEMIRATIGEATERSEGGLGPAVLSRILRASNVFVILNEFWTEVFKGLPELYRAKGDEVKSRAIFERWVEHYKKVFEQIMGSPVSDTAQEMMTSWLNVVQNHQTAQGLMWTPWLQAMPQWREQSERFMKGDWGALSESRSLWREVYDETLGRVLRIPAFGLTKGQTERLRRTYDVSIQFYYSLSNFYQFFYDTGREALKEVFAKVQNLKFEEMTPETMREIYQIWWTTNEKAFFELFRNSDFCEAMHEALNYGLRLKKRLDELSAEWCEALSIPSNREFDEVAMVVQELRRKVRLQQKAIEELQRKLGMTT